ncbi:MAG: hypothetical protein LBI49_20190, partial [Nocardiopsaceae bacterium]|nr:hypothetical protein [Nocardiopsaceae bacterium]
ATSAGVTSATPVLAVGPTRQRRRSGPGTRRGPGAAGPRPLARRRPAGREGAGQRGRGRTWGAALT